jgi:hypothetical protein
VLVWVEANERSKKHFPEAGGLIFMRISISYRLLMMGLSVGLAAAMTAGLAAAQQAPKMPSQSDVYCSGMATDQAIPAETYLVSGENSSYKSTFQAGDLVYINRGAEQGVKVGDTFEVMRPVTDPMKHTKWFKWQSQLLGAMGTMYADIGQIQVVRVLPKTSIAALKLTCDLMQRGDIVRPLAERPAPAFHDEPFDPFAPPSGKKTAMIVTAKTFGDIAGTGMIVYVNLGSGQGVKVGDYFRVFRYQGTHNDFMYEDRNMAYKVYGYGGTPVAYQWDNLPRQVLGEGLVLRTSPNSATVLLTTSRQEMYAGDYVELE